MQIAIMSEKLRNSKFRLFKTNLLQESKLGLVK